LLLCVYLKFIQCLVAALLIKVLILEAPVTLLLFWTILYYNVCCGAYWGCISCRFIWTIYGYMGTGVWPPDGLTVIICGSWLCWFPGI